MLSLLAPVLLATLGAGTLVPPPPAPAARTTVKLAVTDIVGLEELQREFGAFVEVLERATGFEVEFFPVTNRAAAATALRYKRVDFVLTGPAEYVVMRKREGAIPVVGFSRPDYFSGVVVLADSGITSLRQLKGMKVGFASVGSTSGHLGPMQLFADHGVDPLQDVEALHLNTQIAFQSLKRGDVQALGMGCLKFARLRDREVETGGLPPGAFRFIARGPDLPNDVLLAGKHVDEDVVAKLRRAFVERSEELIAAALQGDDNQKYSGMKFLANVKDEDYAYVRDAYRTAGFPEYAEFLGD